MTRKLAVRHTCPGNALVHGFPPCGPYQHHPRSRGLLPSSGLSASVHKDPFFNKLYERSLHRIQTKIHPKVEKYGEFGLALFIGIPLPGSGVYTGALAAFVLDISAKKFMVATVIGVLIAAVLILAAVLTGAEIFQWIIK
ncbi:MAG: small multi-drug export protein [Candidatus Marinimicrobia bacterium]|nr:small multi-drug export protein [Candidatus Neomarinimicrobiota bacterium]